MMVFQIRNWDALHTQESCVHNSKFIRFFVGQTVSNASDHVGGAVLVDDCEAILMS